ncbi:MAG: DUF2130 domain-containing protein [Bacilli bacterium]|nr:DUF2130 domain-containing protein [Bacilli bacterium]
MAKIKDVVIINNHTIRLEVNASIGDEIDLSDLNKIDLSILDQKIKALEDVEYTKRLNALRKEIENEKNQEMLKREKILEDKITRLEADSKNLVLIKEKELDKNYSNQINDLKISIAQKQNEIERINAEVSSKEENAVLKARSELEKKIADLEFRKMEEESKLKEEINNLKRDRSTLNVKKIGEDLESWCDTEYTAYAQTGFQTCDWIKDNKVVKSDDDDKGTKADYIFRVYATEERCENDLLTSVVCEMKSEAPNSVNKKKNEDYYKRLNQNRDKKNCEYALLISELDWDNPNDVPIKKIKEYEKMYMVRPQYFITFLSIISTLSLKYKELLVSANLEREKLKEVIEIENEFEEMKRKLIDDPLQLIEREALKVKDEASKILKSAESINDLADSIIKRGIEKIKSRIDNYSITKITKRVKKLEDK